MTRRPSRTSPNPRLGASIELCGSDTGGLLNLLGVSKTLPGERITAEEAPPALLQIEPTSSGGDEDLKEAWMPGEPSARLEAVMAAEVIGDNEDVARGVLGLNVGQ